MKNKSTFFIALLILLTVGLGCSFIQSGGSSDNSGTTNPDANAKTGVPECDEVVDLITRDMQTQDDNFITRKTREYIVDLVRESIKKNIEQNKGDKVKIAQECKQIKDDYEKKKAEQEKNSNK